MLQGEAEAIGTGEGTLGLPKLFWNLWLGTLINKAGTFVLPFLGIYLVARRGYSVVGAGAVVSLYGLGAIASGPVAGLLADRVGRRPTLIASLGLGGLAMIALGFLRIPWAIAAWTLTLGFVADGYRAPVAAAVGDIVKPEDRMRAYAYLYWATNIGCAVSAAAGGFLAERSYLWLFLLDGGTTLAYAAVVGFSVPETRLQPADRENPFRGLWSALCDPALVAFTLLGLLFGVVLLEAFTTLPLDLRGRGFGPSTIGVILSVNPILVVCLQPLATAAARRFGSTALLVATGVFGAGGALCFAFAHSTAAFVIGMAVLTLGEVASFPVAPAVVAELAPPGKMGLYQGVYTMAFAIAACLSPALGTTLLAHGGSFALWGGCALLGALVALGHWAAAGPRRRQPTRSEAGTWGAARSPQCCRIELARLQRFQKLSDRFQNRIVNRALRYPLRHTQGMVAAFDDVKLAASLHPTPNRFENGQWAERILRSLNEEDRCSQTQQDFVAQLPRASGLQGIAKADQPSHRFLERQVAANPRAHGLPRQEDGPAWRRPRISSSISRCRATNVGSGSGRRRFSSW